MTEPESTQTQKRPETLLNLLAEEGFRPSSDADGDMQFKFEGGTYFVMLTADDDEYYQLVYPNFWPLESGDDRLNALVICDLLNRALKLVKLYTLADTVWAGVESAHATPEAFMHMLPRSLGYLQDAVRAFGQEMTSLEIPKDDEQSAEPDDEQDAGR